MTSETLSKPHGDHVTLAPDSGAFLTLQETLKDFVADYKARDAAPATVYRYRHYVEDYAKWLCREDLSTDMHSLQGKLGYRLLKGYLAYLRDERGAALGTVATAYRALRTFWSWCVRESADEEGEANHPPFVSKSPFDFFTRADVPKDRVADDVGEPYSPEEVARIFDAIGKPNSRDLEVLRNRAIVHVLLASGVRRKELCLLTVSDYNTDTGFILVRRSAAKQTNRVDDSRITTLFGEAMREVNRYVRHLRVSGMGNGPLFPSLRGGQLQYRGGHLRPDTINRLLSRIVSRVQAACPQVDSHASGDGCKECIRYGGVHRFRSTWAIEQLQRGVKPSSVKAAGGWSSYEMLDRYSRKASGVLAVEDIRRVNGNGSRT